MNLLVPIDFSDHSKAAAEYAASMANVYEGNVHLLHVLVPLQDEPDYLPVKTMQAKYNTIAEMYFIQEGLRRKFDLRTSCDLVPGDIASQILRTARRVKSDLIIMGAQGNSGLKQHLYGSHTASVLENSTVPVLTIPEKYKFRPINKFVYVTDFNYSNIKDIKKISDFSASFDTTISIVHIKKTSRYGSDALREDFESLLHSHVSYENIVMEEYDNSDTAEGLKDVLRMQHADVLIVPTRRRSLVEKITGRAEDEDFVFDLNIPLLVL